MRTGVLLLGVYPPDRMISLARWMEDLGIHTLWHGDDKFYRDTTVDLALCAVKTSLLELGTAVLEPYTRHPALIAGTVATLDELSGGRMVVGLGPGGSGFSAMGTVRARPVRRLRETIDIMRAAWTGAEVRYEGETMRFRGKMRFPLLRWGIPIVIGARGRSLLELAGETADGVMISTFADPRVIRYALSHVEAGAARAGRSMDDLRVLCRLDCCIDRDSQEAREAVKPMLVASLKSSYPNWQFLEPLGLTVPEAVREAIVSGERDRIAATAPLLPDTFAEALALCGTSKEVAGQVRRIVELGIGEIAINPIPLPGQRVEEQIEAFQEVASRSAAVPGGAG